MAGSVSEANGLSVEAVSSGVAAGLRVLGPHRNAVIELETAELGDQQSFFNSRCTDVWISNLGSAPRLRSNVSRITAH